MFAAARPSRRITAVAMGAGAGMLLLPAQPALAHPPGVTERVSVSSQGTAGDNDSQLAAVSADGRFVAFVSLASTLVAGDTNGTSDVFVRDRITGTTERVMRTGCIGRFRILSITARPSMIRPRACASRSWCR